MLRVRIYPESVLPHVSQIYAGLYDLQAAGKIHIDFTAHLSPEARSHEDRALLWVEVFDSATQRTRKLCFDLSDGGMVRRGRLEACDIYFKRSYSLPRYSKFDAGLRSKILPYGLNYVCLSRNEQSIIRRALFANFLSWQHKSPRRYREEFLSSLFLLQSSYGMKFLRSKLFRFVEDFEISPGEPCEAKILFQTRVWDPQLYGSDAPGVEKLNQRRVDLVRGLREHFGNDFIGGLVASPYARKQYADCLTRNPTDPESYLSLAKRCQVAISTVGLYNSTPWKLAEYLASSRCIVSEPLAFDLPTPLKEDQNVITFRTVPECIRACERLLTDPELAKTMRHKNYSYYQQHVKPAALVSRCVTTALHLPTRAYQADETDVSFRSGRSRRAN